ncbi:MAG: S9 family peptidase [Bacteroidaceae bacterium]|nr:S9 family peptidase [Bacteroidaceae bacterium]
MKKLLLAMSCWLVVMTMIQARQFTPELLWKMGRIGSYDANGKNIVYNVSYYDVEQNKSHTVIKINNKNLTSSSASEQAPKFTADGMHITFLATDKDGISQLWIMKTDGTDRCQISFCKTDIDDYQFSPDGTKVILIHQIPSIQPAYSDLPKSNAHLVTEVMYRHWDEWVKTIPHPFVADFDGNKIGIETDILAGEPYECPMKPFGGIEQLCWSPDSKQIAYTCRKLTGLDYATSTDSDIFLYSLADHTTKNLCKPDGYTRPKVDYTLSLKDQAVNHQTSDLNVGYDINPQFSPDGKYIAWQSMKHDGYESDRNRLCILNLKNGEKTYVTEDFDSNVEGFCWDVDNKSLYFIGVWHGEIHVYSTNLKGKVTKLTEGQYDYTGVQFCDGRLICGRQSMCEPTDLFALDIKTRQLTQLTDENKEIKSQVDWGSVEPRWVKTVDGKDMLSWIILPPHFNKNKKYPTLLFCEGGPQSPVSQFWSYRWNLMIMAANDYVIVAPNRRGLPGFGSAWNEEISTNYGGHCMDDLLTAIDDAVNNLPYVNKDKLGCVGASFGGYSAYWLAGHHNKRFKAFIAHDGIYNLEQQYAETEEAWFTNWDLGGAPWHKDREEIRRTYANSPHLFVDKWDTPILCIHGGRDYRIVDSQAMAAFNAARYRGIEAQLLDFPEENHWVLKPQNGILWQRTFFAWLEKYLK